MSSVLHVRRLDDLPAVVSLEELLGSYLLHVRSVIAAATNLYRPAPYPSAVADDALVAIVCACGIVQRLGSGRWEMVHEALAHQAAIEDVCAASGLEPDEIRVGLSSWADARHRQGQFSDREHAAVVALVSPSPREGGR